MAPTETARASHPDERDGDGDGDGDLSDAGADVSELRDAREAHANQPLLAARRLAAYHTADIPACSFLPRRGGSLCCYVKPGCECIFGLATSPASR